MIIREATQNELKEIQRLAQQVQKEATMGYINETNRLPGTDGDHSDIGQYFILVDKGKMKGWILLGEVLGPYTNEISDMIYELYVLPAFRNAGVGQLLMEFAFTYAKHKGLNKVQLNVFSGNRAKELYRRLGFVEVAAVMERKL